MRIAVIAVAAIVLASAIPATADEAARTLTVDTLESGDLAAGADELSAMVDVDGDNHDARLGLGMVQFLQAVEHLSQGLYRYGLQPPRSFMLPIMRLPVPVNPNPEPVNYDKFRQLLLGFVADLATAEQTLAGVRSPDVKIPVDIAAIRYDSDGNGAVESLAQVFAIILDVDINEIESGVAVVAFDTADAYWFRGYTHVLMALGEFLLAYDWRESFDVSFHVFFPRVQSPFQEALAAPDMDSFLGSETAIADLISFLHIRWPIGEPERMAAVRGHLKAMVAMSRAHWAATLAEFDNDREWIPAANQVSYLGTPVTAVQIEAWHQVLDEVEALLEGRKLLPHWRFDKGVNLRRVFEEPRPFDLVLWITGPAAFPYLEDGEILTSERWRDIIGAFEGSFGSYAIWFN
jgi:hypothetical protein